jgi:hypothetical protein
MIIDKIYLTYQSKISLNSRFGDSLDLHMSVLDV